MTIYREIKTKLRIPDNYHLADAPAPKISMAERRDAAMALVGAGQLDSTEGLITAICKRFQAYTVRPPAKRGEARPRSKSELFAINSALRLARTEKITAFILNNPRMGATAVGDKFGVSESTARKIRSRLRKEGRIA